MGLLQLRLIRGGFHTTSGYSIFLWNGFSNPYNWMISSDTSVNVSCMLIQLSRVGALALYTLLWILANIWTIDNVGGRPKFIMICRGVAAHHIGEIYDWRRFFSGDFSCKRTADPEHSSPTYYTSIDAVPAKNVPFGGLTDTSHPVGELSPKNPHFMDVNGDSQLKRLQAYLCTGESYHDAW
jgi:hypothetical protein